MDDLYVVANIIGGFRQRPLFTGTLVECEAFMENNPGLGYGNDNTNIYLDDEWEVDYL